MNIENYYLDLQKISYLSDGDKIRIHEYYRDMIYSFQDGRDTIGVSLFNTLNQAGYLVSIRDEKIEKILNEDNCISS